MQQLGYSKYVMQGGDFGGVILSYQAHLYPEQVVSILDNFWVTQPNDTDLTRYAANTTTADETAYIDGLTAFIDHDSGYRLVQQNQPLSAAFALTASPTGFAMWIYTLMRRAIDVRVFDCTAEEIITWSLMYTIQGPYSGLRYYKEVQNDGALAGTGSGTFPYVSQRVAISEFSLDIWYQLPLDWAQRSGNVLEPTSTIEVVTSRRMKCQIFSLEIYGSGLVIETHLARMSSDRQDRIAAQSQ